MQSNRVKETTTTTGTGSLTLAGAATNFQSFNTAFGTDTWFRYWIVDDTNNVWESGIGYLSASTTLVRTTVLDNSSNTTSALSLSSGTKDVFCAPAENGLSPTMTKQAAQGSQILGSPNWCNFSSVTVTTDRVYYIPYYCGYEGQIDSLICQVSAAAGTLLRLGLYEVDNDGDPGGIILESGDLSPGTTGTKTYSFTAQYIKAGWYYMAICSNGATDFRAVNRAAGSYFDLTGCDAVNFRPGGFLYEANGGSWTTLPATASASLTLLHDNAPIVALGTT